MYFAPMRINVTAMIAVACQHDCLTYLHELTPVTDIHKILMF